MTFVEIPLQNVMNRDLFRIDRSSYISPCYFSLVLTAFYGKMMQTPNVAKF
jgi:3-dehydroquinate dehydratase